jgi:SAM-dependent methyltransferase
MSCSDPILTTGKRHPIFTRVFARVGPAMDTQGALEHRRALLAGLAGRVLEVGAGNGLNFAHYPPAVTELLAVEPEPYLRALAETAAHQAAIPIRVVDSTADALPSPDAGMDAAIASLVLCSVPDQARALAELRRVLRPQRRASLLRAHPSRHLRPGQGPAPRRHHLAHPCWRLPHQPRHADRHHHCRFPTHQHPPVPVPDSRLPSPAAPHVLGIARRPPES